MSAKLIFGTVSRQRLQSLSPIGVVNGREVFSILGAEDDHSADSSDDDHSDDDDGDDDSDDDEEDADAKAKSKTRRSSRNQDRSTAYLNSLKRERNKLLKEKQDREKADREAELKGKSEVERVTVERDEAVTARTTLEAENVALKTELGIIRASARGKKYEWLDIEDVLNDKVLRRSIEIDDDGELVGVEEALKDLAKRKPHYLAKSSKDEDDSEKDKGRNNGNGRQQQQNGSTGGQPGTGNNGDQRVADRQRLSQTYPILGRLPQ